MSFSPRRGTLRLAASLAATTLALTACTSSSQSSPPTDAPTTTSNTVRVSAVAGDRDAELLAVAYVQALEANAIPAQLVAQGAQTPGEQTLGGLEADTIDVVVGGSQELLSVPKLGDPVPRDAAAVRGALDAGVGDGARVVGIELETRRHAVVPSTGLSVAMEEGALKALKGHCDKASIGLQGTWAEAWLPRLKAGALCAPASEQGGMSGEQLLAGLLDEQLDLGLVFSTDPGIKGRGLRALDDPDGTLGVDPVATVASRTRVGQDALAVLSKVSEKVDGERFTQWRAATAEDGPVSADDAGRWLVDEGVVRRGESGLPASPTPSAT